MSESAVQRLANALPIPELFRKAISLNADWAGPTGKRTQFDILNGRLRPALDLKPCSLARWTRSIHIQKNGAWREIGGIIIEMLVSVLQTR